MSPRTGRPKSENPKDVRFSIRLDAETFDKLQQCCNEEATTVAEIIRRAIHQFLEQK